MKIISHSYLNPCLLILLFQYLPPSEGFVAISWFFSLLFYNHVFLLTCVFDWMLNIRDDLKPWMVFLPQRRFKCASCKLLRHCEVYIALIQTKMGFSALGLLFICSLPVSLGCSPLGWQPKPGVFSYTKEVLNCNFC